jgi:hypothetical protein
MRQSDWLIKLPGKASQLNDQLNVQEHQLDGMFGLACGSSKAGQKLGRGFISKASPKSRKAVSSSPINSKIKLTYSRIVAQQVG